MTASDVVEREAQICWLLAAGFKTSQIGELLDMDSSTASKKKRKLRQKSPEYIDWMLQCPAIEEAKRLAEDFKDISDT